MRRRVVAHRQQLLKSASLPCAHVVSLPPRKEKMLVFHPTATVFRIPPQEIALLDDQTRAAELHSLVRKHIWLEYEGSYPGLLRNQKILASRVGTSPKVSAKYRKALELEPGDEETALMWLDLKKEKYEMSYQLSQLHLEVDRDGNVPHVTNFPSTLSLQRLMSNPEIPAEIAAALVPYHMIRAMRAADEWEKKGVPVAALNGAHLHPRFGVFSPTRQDYVTLFAQHLPEIVKSFPSNWLAEDLGSGSGVLSFLLAKNGAAHVHGFDVSLAAVEAAREDAAALGLSNVSFHLADLTTPLPKEVRTLPKPHVIVCNPPWLQGTPSSALEAAIYDPNYSFLRSVLVYAHSRLQAGGRFLLIFSNLASLLGHADTTFVLRSAADAGFRLVRKFRLPPAQPTTEQEGDAYELHSMLADIKALERISLYEFEPVPQSIPSPTPTLPKSTTTTTPPSASKPPASSSSKPPPTKPAAPHRRTIPSLKTLK